MTRSDLSLSIKKNPECARAGLSLRPATPEDECLLLEVYAGTRLSELELVPWNDDQKLAFIKTQFDARQAQYREAYSESVTSIVLQRGEPVGAITIDKREHETALVDIALLPQYRNAGLGKLLMKALMEEAAGEKLPVTLHVLTTSPAVRFYERLGFITTDADGAYLRMSWTPNH